MPTAQTQVVEGTTTIASVPFSINLGFIPTSFHFWNFSKYNTATDNLVLEAEWNQYLADNSAYVLARDTEDGDDYSALMTVGGIISYDGGQGPLLGPSLVGTTITKSSGSFAVSAHGLVVGDVFIVSNNVVMKQLGGNFFQVATVTDANNFIITNPGFMNTANFSNESAFVIRRLRIPVEFIPQRNLIVAITQANPMVVTTAFSHGLQPGQKVRLHVPANFGMVEAEGIQAVISAVTATTFTLGAINNSAAVNSLAFTAFAWPASASPFKSGFPQVVPFGSGPFGNPAQDLLDDQVRNQAFQGVVIGSGDGTFIMPVATDVIHWRAIRADSNV